MRNITFPIKSREFSFNISGAMNAGVPAVPRNNASPPVNSLLTPKSAIWTGKQSTEYCQISNIRRTFVGN